MATFIPSLWHPLGSKEMNPQGNFWNSLINIIGCRNKSKNRGRNKKIMKSSQAVDDSLYETDCENIDDYGPDGYYAATIGEELKDGRYKILQKLGWGHFSTVWLAEDLRFGHSDFPNANHQYVALKIQRSKENHCEAAKDEVKLLNSLKVAKNSDEWLEDCKILNKRGLPVSEKENFCVELLDRFPHYGTYGKHYCTTFEILGPTLLDVIKFFEKKYKKGLPIWLVKKISSQLLAGLHYMHKTGNIIHTDLKPENVVLQIPPEKLKSTIDALCKSQKLPQSMRYLAQLSLERKQEDAETDSLEPTGELLSPNHAMDSEKNRLGEESTRLEESVSHSNNLQASRSLKEALGGGEISTLFSQADSVNIGFDEKSINQHTEKEASPKSRPALSEAPPSKEPEETKSSNFCPKNKIIKEEDSKNPKPPSQPMKSKEASESQGKDLKKPSSSAQSFNSSSTPKKTTTAIEEEEEFDYDGTNFVFKWKDSVDIFIDQDVKIKIVDFGNACWTYHHFTGNIQTREYRAPEVILGLPYRDNTDIWSLACMIFELLTGDYLFRPYSRSQKPRDDLHLALFMSTLGDIPLSMALGSRLAKKFFGKNGKLKKIAVPAEYNISQILTEEYGFSETDAKGVRYFLTPMLRYLVDKRASAWEMLSTNWLWKPTNSASNSLELGKRQNSEEIEEEQKASEEPPKDETVSESLLLSHKMEALNFPKDIGAKPNIEVACAGMNSAPPSFLSKKSAFTDCSYEMGSIPVKKLITHFTSPSNVSSPSRCIIKDESHLTQAIKLRSSVSAQEKSVEEREEYSKTSKEFSEKSLKKESADKSTSLVKSQPNTSLDPEQEAPIFDQNFDDRRPSADK